MKRALVFGAAGVGAEVKRLFKKQGIDVVAFADNAEWKWGREFEECPIIPPQTIVVSQYDVFAIGVLGAVGKIKEQLLQMGVEPEKIVIPVTGPGEIFMNEMVEVVELASNECIVLKIGGAEIQTDEIKEYLRNKKTLTFDFRDNIWAFQYFVEDCIYTAELLEMENYFNMYPVAKMASLTLDVYILDDCSKYEILKKEKRLLCCKNNYPLKRMLLNKNTFNFHMERLPRPFDTVLMKNIECLKKSSNQYNLPLEEICVVSGTILQMYGLKEGKKDDDLDIIMTSKFRDLYGKAPVVISDQVEMHSQNELLLNKCLRQELSDDQIIGNEEFHFRFRGCKFLCLDLVYQQKKNINREYELRLMDYFYGSKEYK